VHASILVGVALTLKIEESTTKGNLFPSITATEDYMHAEMKPINDLLCSSQTYPNMGLNCRQLFKQLM
jgi:hypothetical protein